MYQLILEQVVLTPHAKKMEFRGEAVTGRDDYRRPRGTRSGLSLKGGAKGSRRTSRVRNDAVNAQEV